VKKKFHKPEFKHFLPKLNISNLIVRKILNFEIRLKNWDFPCEFSQESIQFLETKISAFTFNHIISDNSISQRNESNNKILLLGVEVLPEFAKLIEKIDSKTTSKKYDSENLKSMLETIFPKLNYKIELDSFYSIIRENPSYTTSQIRVKYNEVNQNKKISNYNCRKLLKLLNFSKLTGKPKSLFVFTQHFKNEMFIYLNFFLHYTKNGFDFIYIDEASFNRKSFKRIKDWAHKRDYFYNYRIKNYKNFKNDF
jgi:hypothetical protein